MKKYALIVAGGSGTRMMSATPKQFLLIEGEPIIYKTINKFLKAGVDRIIVVIPKSDEIRWLEVANLFSPEDHSKIKYVFGGATRTDSVRSGLKVLESPGLVAIHDAVRPYVDSEVISESFQCAETHGSGVAVVPLKESIRENMGDSTSARDRSNYVIVQTPQTFRIEEIQEAYQKVKSSETDDATVYEKAGYEVTTVAGNYGNIKITTPEDLK